MLINQLQKTNKIKTRIKVTEQFVCHALNIFPAKTSEKSRNNY